MIKFNTNLQVAMAPGRPVPEPNSTMAVFAHND